jgi:hypothetical protein
MMNIWHSTNDKDKKKTEVLGEKFILLPLCQP